MTDSHESWAKFLPHLRPIHPFPARMAPDIALANLARLRSSRRLHVLDPMLGSGTTVATARLMGHHASGFDTDPLAVLIARAWTSDISLGGFARAVDRVLAYARAIKPTVKAANAYPAEADEETRAFVRYWFDPLSRVELTALALAIHICGGAFGSLLWCAFSRLIVTKESGVSRAMDVSHSRPHRVYERGPIRPLNAYARAADIIAARSPFTSGSSAPKAYVCRGDARSLPVEDASIDVVITSPPYGTAIDYLRGHRLSLVWMGHSIAELRGIRASNVGTERGDASLPPNVEEMFDLTEALPKAESGRLKRYVHDISQTLSELQRVLKPGGRAVVVVGDSNVGGIYISHSRVIKHLAELAGLRHSRSDRRPLPSHMRYLPPPRANRAGRALSQRMSEEVVLTFVRA